MQLPLFYAVCEVVFAGGSMFAASSPTDCSSTIADAAVSGCAVLAGGQADRMAEQLNAAAIAAAEEAAAIVQSTGR